MWLLGPTAFTFVRLMAILVCLLEECDVDGFHTPGEYIDRVGVYTLVNRSSIRLVYWSTEVDAKGRLSASWSRAGWPDVIRSRLKVCREEQWYSNRSYDMDSEYGSGHI